MKGEQHMIEINHDPYAEKDWFRGEFGDGIFPTRGQLDTIARAMDTSIEDVIQYAAASFVHGEGARWVEGMHQAETYEEEPFPEEKRNPPPALNRALMRVLERITMRLEIWIVKLAGDSLPS